MLDVSKIKALHDVFDEMVGSRPTNALAQYTPPIDIDAPNQHGSKREFKQELHAVEASMADINNVFDTLFATEDDEPEKRESCDGLGQWIDDFGRRKIKSDPVTSPMEIVRQSTFLTGLRRMYLMLSLDMISALEERHKELKDQEKEFWTVSHRPPNQYARIIALRTARVYAVTKGEFPTLGTSRDGGHPSTSFGRGLEQIFNILGIEAKIRGPAKWAIGQLTEADTKPPKPAPMGGILGMMHPPDYENELSQGRGAFRPERPKGRGMRKTRE